MGAARAKAPPVPFEQGRPVSSVRAIDLILETMRVDAAASATVCEPSSTAETEDDGCEVAGDEPPKSAAISHVGNGAVNGSTVSAINNAANVRRIIVIDILSSARRAPALLSRKRRSFEPRWRQPRRRRAQNT